MEQDLELDLGEDNTEEIISRKDKKINSYAEKLKLSEQEKAELAQKESDARTHAESAEKERDFFKNFNSLSTKYPGATDHQDAIWEKVKSGYDVEDAAISVLAKEGKYTPEPPTQDLVAGGSASTSIIDSVEKTPDRMTQEERKAILQDLERKGEFKL
jgi:hypothetical protein